LPPPDLPTISSRKTKNIRAKNYGLDSERQDDIVIPQRVAGVVELMKLNEGTMRRQHGLARPASVAGGAVDEKGSPLVDYTLMVFPSATEAAGVSGRAFDMPLRRVHDPAGRFTISNLPAGDYELHFRTGSGLSGNARVHLDEGQAARDVTAIVKREATAQATE
jgi:hypothetical protein